MKAAQAKKKREVAPPKKALFTMVVNKKTTKVPDRELRMWTDKAEQAIADLFSSAKIRGRYELIHDAMGSKRMIHVEAKAGVHRALDLFDEQSGKQELNVTDAGERIVQQAKQELVRFVKATQSISLQEIADAAQRVEREQQSLDRHLVAVVRGSEQGRLHVATHESDHLLTAYLNGGVSVLQKRKIVVLAKVLSVGETEAVVMPDKVSRQRHAWIRSTLRLQFAPDRADDESMTRLYVTGVRRGQLLIVRGLRIRAKEGRGGSSLFVEQAVRFAGRVRAVKRRATSESDENGSAESSR